MSNKPWKTTVQLYDAKRREWRDYAVSLEIDWARIARELGDKARKNKSKRTIALGGAIKCTVSD